MLLFLWNVIFYTSQAEWTTACHACRMDDEGSRLGIDTTTSIGSVASTNTEEFFRVSAGTADVSVGRKEI